MFNVGNEAVCAELLGDEGTDLIDPSISAGRGGTRGGILAGGSGGEDCSDLDWYASEKTSGSLELVEGGVSVSSLTPNCEPSF